MKKTILLFIASLLLFSTQSYSQIFDVVGVEIREVKTDSVLFREINIPTTIVLTNDSTFNFINRDKNNVFIIMNFWNEGDITWYVLTDNKENYFDVTLTKLNDLYYILSFDDFKNKIDYDLKISD